jgi:two-component system chemotaxis response regulator CheB
MNVQTKLRAVIVDDSATVRALLAGILGSDPEIEVVGAAGDGEEGVRLVQKLRPDVVTMDIHMPRMNGFEATKEIMITAPTPIVIVTASTMAHDVDSAMSALRTGALTILRKPPGPESPEFEEAVRHLVSTVKTMAQVKVVRHHRRAAPARGAKRAEAARGTEPVAAVAIAASTGGPQALQRLLGDLPRDFPAPILVVQHISAGFTEGLAAWLARTVSLRVKVAQDGEPLLSSTVYIAAEGGHLGVSREGKAALSAAPPIGGFRPSGTYLFQSIAEAFGSASIGVIMTGMGEDGVEGLRALRDAGAFIIAQDESSSVVFGMPGAAVREGLASVVLPLDEISGKLTQRVRGA